MWAFAEEFYQVVSVSGGGRFSIAATLLIGKQLGKALIRVLDYLLACFELGFAF